MASFMDMDMDTEILIDSMEEAKCSWVNSLGACHRTTLEKSLEKQSLAWDYL